ncbi:MAG: bacteriorhodopsin [Opitutales bacterium]
MNDILTLLDQGSPLEIVTYFTFLVTFLGMAAGAFYFAMERGSMPERYREGVAVSALIVGIAAANYFFMQGLYLETVLGDGQKTFPTIFRYIDWILTTPLMLLKFPLLLGMGRKGRQFLYKLIGLDLAMIGFAFAGELMEANVRLHYAFFGIAVICWFFVVYLIFSALRVLPDWATDADRQCVNVMAKFILFGWLIYPLGYLFPSFGVPAESRELMYNVGDLINKVGLAMVVYACALRFHKEAEAEEDEYEYEEAPAPAPAPAR